MRVYREGSRIRNEAGTGYSDRVSDDDILRHLRDSGRDDDSYPTFAYAVLGLRMHERDLAERAAKP